ncbi:MAG: hypothetical protein PW792_10705 [Acidobacteriaceae bacterium]|nr:hypothetical protein [Acidobacteriaceae bacterium]
MWELWGHPIAGAIGTTRTARRLLKPVVILFCIGVFVAGVIYVFVVLKAVSERNNSPHVHAHSTQ